MTFYQTQHLNAAAVYNRRDGLFVGMIRQIALSESAAARLTRETLGESLSQENLPLVFDRRWHAAPDFAHHPLQYAMKHAVPEILSPIFDKLVTTQEIHFAEDDDHVLIKCDPWLSPEPTLELALKKSTYKVA